MLESTAMKRRRRKTQQSPPLVIVQQTNIFVMPGRRTFLAGLASTLAGFLAIVQLAGEVPWSRLATRAAKRVAAPAPGSLGVTGYAPSLHVAASMSEGVHLAESFHLEVKRTGR